MTTPVYPMTRATGCPFDPPPRLRELQAEAPLTKVNIFGKDAWLVTRYDDQRTLLADPRLSSDVRQPGYPSPTGEPPRKDGVGIGFILMDDPEHARLRRMVTAPFMIKRIEAMRPGVQKIVDGLIDDLLAGPKPVDLVEAFALPVPSLVICQLLGVPYADHDFFQQNSKNLIRMSATPQERAAAHGNLATYLDNLVGEKLENPGDDLLSGLTDRIRSGELTRQDAAGIGVLLLLAGHETTANMIALGTLALLEHPDQLAVLRETDDPKVVAGAAEELLRYLNITHNGRRRAILEDIELHGQVLKAGDGVILPNDIGNRDPSVFEDPDALDLGRDARRHVAFGFGVHQCLGQPLARMELQVVYSTLYRRIPTLGRAVGLEEIPFKHDGAVYGVYSLPVTW
ncbi:cytochrome P450 [Kribbella sp.]|uniref:cytochrome P450 n=1 Tax=Kribbella sp. TaxID=1871183 RepID=UPI002D3E2F16|nr:cytochrome P450 [Kribbella sp.]HZX04581.1 cytochrome P450 [Kribbella sp.]